MNGLKQALNEGRFVCVLEVIPQHSSPHLSALGQVLQHGRLADWPLLPAYSDRVGLRCDLSPLEGAAVFDYPAASLLHFSGKDREGGDLLGQMESMKAHGLKQLLVLSGDRLPGHQPGKSPMRYLESVPALQLARAHGPDWLLGAALNPFKYREEEGYAQYLKAQKKLSAGADFLTLQLGFDATKHLEAQSWMRTRPDPKPMLACVMQLTARRGRALQDVPGIVITDSMRAVLALEQDVSSTYATTRSLERLALQIVGLQLMGYAGIHLSGLHTLEELLALEQAICEQRKNAPSMNAWAERWQANWEMPEAPSVSFAPDPGGWRLGQSDINASPRERFRYTLLSEVHQRVFSGQGWFSQALGWAMTRPFWTNGIAARALHAAERMIKRPLVGCDTCGRCRLQETIYICPETCPKGLANGPCGGTRLNRCEFGDRECIHSVKYRIAKSADRLPLLEQALIPNIDVADRHRSSWPAWFKQDESSEKR